MAHDKKAQREQQVARLFCHWYSRHRGASCEFVRLAAPPAPDGVIRIAGAEICVELARYRELGAHNRLFQYDQALKNAIFERSLRAAHLPHCTPTLSYREPRPGCYTIPPTDKHDSFIAELFDLVRWVAALADGQFAEVTFGKQARAAARKRTHQGRLVIEEEVYPAVSRFCRAVRVHRHPGLRFGRPGSTMDARFSRIDFESITTTVTQKLGKVSGYRNAISGRPLWLLFYSEGYPPTAHLAGPDYNERVVQHLDTICGREADGFDAVWWLDQVCAAQGPTAYCVIEEARR